MPDPRWYRIDDVAPMVRRIALAVTSLLGLGLVSDVSAPFAADKITIQEMFLRVKPAVVLVIAEVSAEVTLDCGGGTQTVTPPVFRETGTGWFGDGRRRVLNNAHRVDARDSP